MSPARPLLAACLLGLTALAGLVPDAHAQQIYRITGPDGRVTFSDQRPLDPGAQARAAPAVALGASGNVALPFELQQAVSRYPVTLYVGPTCDPCVAGRAFLSGRGVPFNERTVSSNEDIQALQRLSRTNALPFMTIGAQQLTGFSETEWSQFLDAAGYPRTSQLPASYRPAPATALVAAQQPTSPARPVAAAPTPAAGSPPATAVEAPAPNPIGIRF